MKCKGKRCALESMHKGRCSEVGPYAVATPDVATEPVATRLTKSERKKLALVKPEDVKTEAGRVQKWREANREKYNKWMREYRKKKKAGFIGIAYG